MAIKYQTHVQGSSRFWVSFTLSSIRSPLVLSGEASWTWSPTSLITAMIPVDSQWIPSPLLTGSSLYRPLRAIGWMVDQVRKKARNGSKEHVPTVFFSFYEC